MAATIALATGVTLAYHDQGDRSDFAVVCLPGPTDSWHSYQPVIDRMPSSLRCVAVSQRGHGDSEKPVGGHRIQDFADDALALLDGLGIQRTVLVGHSGSCLTVRRVALDHPTRVAGVVLEAAPTTLRGDPALTQFVDSVVATLDEPVGAEFARSFVRDTSAADIDDRVVDQLADELAKVPAHVWRAMFAELLAYDDVAQLGRLTMPALLIWGDADELVRSEVQEELMRRIPNATLTRYDGVGHTPRWEKPERFAADVADFAQSLRASL